MVLSAFLEPVRKILEGSSEVDKDKPGLPDCKGSHRQGEYITHEKDTPLVLASEESTQKVSATGEGEPLLPRWFESVAHNYIFLPM